MHDHSFKVIYSRVDGFFELRLRFLRILVTKMEASVVVEFFDWVDSVFTIFVWSITHHTETSSAKLVVSFGHTIRGRINSLVSLYYQRILYFLYHVRLDLCLQLLKHTQSVNEYVYTLFAHFRSHLSQVYQSSTFLDVSVLTYITELGFPLISLQLYLSLEQTQFQLCAVLCLDLMTEVTLFVEYIPKPEVLAIQEVNPVFVGVLDDVVRSFDPHLCERVSWQHFSVSFLDHAWADNLLSLFFNSDLEITFRKQVGSVFEGHDINFTVGKLLYLIFVLFYSSLSEFSSSLVVFQLSVILIHL